MVPLRSSISVSGNSITMNNKMSAGGGVLDLIPGRKNGRDLAVEWSVDEQSKLEAGLAICADEPSFAAYIKIAAMLPKRTVRDVALRCRWMKKKKEHGKWRKPEENCAGKKMKDKEMVAPASSVPPAPSLNMAPYSLMMHHNNQSSCEEIDGTSRQLLNENVQVFYSIAANLATLKIKENVNLFHRTRNNITAILNNMRDMPGIMRHMPPLPVSINEELVNAILPNTAQAMIFC